MSSQRHTRLGILIFIFLFLVSCALQEDQQLQMAQFLRSSGEHLVHAGNQGELDEALVSLGQNQAFRMGTAGLSHSFEQTLAFDRSDQEQGVLSDLAGVAQDGVANTLISGAKTFIRGGDMEPALQKGMYALVSSGVENLEGHINQSELPFIHHVELEWGVGEDQKPEWSWLSIHPLFESSDLRDTWFGQFRTGRSGDRTTVNTGIAYRYMPSSEEYLLGLNGFFDAQFPYGHTRVSLGADAQWHVFGAYINGYLPVSDWTKTRYGYQEKALGGYDLMVSGTLPWLPMATMYASFYEWNRTEGEEDLIGRNVSLELTPVKAVTMRVAVDDANSESPSIEGSVRLNHRFGESVADQWSVGEAMKLTSMRDRRYDKVRRENEVKVQERMNPGFIATFVQSLNLANTVGGAAIILNQQVPFDTNITALTAGDGSGGAADGFVQVRFGDGAILNISGGHNQDTVVQIGLGVITLVSGNTGGYIQYISNDGYDRTVNVPGGTIELLGTDIDARTMPGGTTVRIRDGAILANNTVAGGTQRGDDGEILYLTSANTQTLTSADPEYVSHVEDAFEQIDIVNPDPVSIANAAPYLVSRPQLVSAPSASGDPVDIRLTFNKDVTVSGSPQLDLTIGGNGRTATYLSGSGSKSLVFHYALQGADAGATGVTINAVDLNGGSIKSGSKNALTTITSTDQAFSGGIAGAPFITGVTVSADDDYLPDQNIDITVSYNENITVTGSPRLAVTLESGSTYATYNAGASTATDIVFRYTVQAGDEDSDGITVASTIDLNSGTMQDADTNNAPTNITVPDTSGVRLFEPTMISGLQLWLDAMDSSTVINTGGLVDEWRDKSGNNYHFYDTAPGERPSYSTDVGLPAVDFDGGSKYLDGPVVISGTVARTVMVVTRPRTLINDSVNTVFSLAFNETTGTGYGVFIEQPGGAYGLALRVVGNKVMNYTASTTRPNLILLGSAANSNVSDTFFYVDGTSVTNVQAEIDQVLNTNTLQGAFIGGYKSGDGLYPTNPIFDYNGAVFSIIVFDKVLSTVERQKLEGFIAHKWDMETYLPGGHPYK